LLHPFGKQIAEFEREYFALHSINSAVFAEIPVANPMFCRSILLTLNKYPKSIINAAAQRLMHWNEQRLKKCGREKDLTSAGPICLPGSAGFAPL
jgi:hypothetical protein